MSTSVFLSHAAADLDLVRKVVSHAQPLDVSAYVYEDDLQPGSPLATKLEARLRDADALIVLLTRNSQHRPSVNSEVGFARALGKPIIPVLEVGVDPLQFAFLQGLEFVVLDLERVDEALLGIQHGLVRVKAMAKDNALVTAAVLLVIAALIYYAAKKG